MRRMIALMAMLAAMLLSGTACAQTVTGFGLTVPDTATAIDLGEARVTDVDALAAFLRGLPALENVDMYESALTKEQMAYLSEAFPQITFGWTYRVGDHTVRTDITAFSTLHGTCPDPSHSEREFQWLKFCKGLKAIDVGHNWITDVSFVTNFPELKVLILAVSPITDITPLAELKELEYLELFTNRVTDITPLTGLTNLRDLNLKNNPVTDLTPLFGMTWLERLWVGGPRMEKVPKEQIGQLYEALPDCEIDWDSQPTGGTWREHPHYDTIYRMFRTQVYEPFDM